MSIKSESDLRRTLRAGHEEYFDVLCDSCLTENRQIEAKGYCQNCKQNICDDCIKSHKKLAGLKSHVIEKDPKASTSRSESKELEKLKSDLQKLQNQLTVYKTSTYSLQSDVIQSYTEIAEEIQQWRIDINNTLDKLQKDLLEKASTLKTERLGSLAENSISCKELITQTNKMLKDLDDKMKLEHSKQLETLQQTQEALSKMQQDTDRLEEQCKPRKLSFYRHEKIMTCLSTLGLATVYLSGEPANIQAKYERDIYVKSNKYTQDSNILSATVLPDGRLCLCDCDNKSIKLVDKRLMKISDQLTFDNNPIGATVIHKEELAVLINSDKNLQILSVSPTLRNSRTISLSNIYIAISYCEDKLLLTKRFTSGYGAVDICDMRGNRMKSIETNVDGSKIFTRPFSFCTSPDNSMMYVTDGERHTVVCLNKEGDVINVYRHEKLKFPRGITVDYDGNVYVCSNHNHMIHQLTRTGEHVQILLDENNGIEFPRAIAYKSGQLFISSGSTTQTQRNNIKIFRLTQKCAIEYVAGGDGTHVPQRI